MLIIEIQNLKYKTTVHFFDKISGPGDDIFRSASSADFSIFSYST